MYVTAWYIGLARPHVYTLYFIFVLHQIIGLYSKVMIPTEHIVENYYRVVKNNFTITDLKVKGGNNRQLDILAFDPITKVLMSASPLFGHLKLEILSNFKCNEYEKITIHRDTDHLHSKAA